MMIDDVQNALSSVLGSIPQLANALGAGRLFELYITSGIALGMQNRGLFTRDYISVICASNLMSALDEPTINFRIPGSKS